MLRSKKENHVRNRNDMSRPLEPILKLQSEQLRKSKLYLRGFKEALSGNKSEFQSYLSRIVC